MEIVEYLLSRGGDPNIFSRTTNVSTLWWATVWCNLDMIKLLVKYKLDLAHKNLENLQDSETHHSPFQYCCSNVDKNNNTRFECLLYFVKCSKMYKFDIDLSLVNKSGQNVLHGACEMNSLTHVKYLIDNLNILDKNKNLINSCDKSLRTPFMYAADNGNLDIIQYLLTHPKCQDVIDINCRDVQGMAALHFMAQNNCYKAVEWFLNFKNNMDRSRNNETKEEKNDTSVHTVNTSLITREVRTPLETCIILCNDLKQRKLVNSGELRTALRVAIKNGETKCVRIILFTIVTQEKMESWQDLVTSGLVKQVDEWIELVEAPDYETKHNREAWLQRYLFTGILPSSQLPEFNPSERDNIAYFLTQLRHVCVKTQNFELFVAMLDDSNNILELTQKSVQIRHQNFKKLCFMFDAIKKRNDKAFINAMHVVSDIIIKMIETKEMLNDTLMMIAFTFSQEKFLKAIVESVKDSVSIENENAKYGAWFKQCIIPSNLLCLRINSNENGIDTLFELIKNKSIEVEMVKQQQFIKDEICKLDKEDWNNLVNFNAPLRVVKDNLTQNQALVYSGTQEEHELRNVMDNNGINVEFKEKDLIIDHLSGFNGQKLYDNQVYLTRLLIAAYSVNPIFQRDCARIFDGETLQVPCVYKPGPIKAKQVGFYCILFDYVIG